MSGHKSPASKPFDGKEPKRPFRVVEKCQEFTAKLYRYTAKAEKEYRLTICQKIQGYACDLVHCARIANSYDLMMPERREMHSEALELIEKVNDLLPVMRLRCISIKQEAELQKNLFNLRFGYGKWIASDESRIAQSKKDKENKG